MSIPVPSCAILCHPVPSCAILCHPKLQCFLKLDILTYPLLGWFWKGRRGWELGIFGPFLDSGGEQLQRLVKDPYSSNVPISENQNQSKSSEKAWRHSLKRGKLQIWWLIIEFSSLRGIPSPSSDHIDDSSKSLLVDECRDSSTQTYWGSSSMNCESLETSTKDDKGFDRALPYHHSWMVVLVGSISADKLGCNWFVIETSWVPILSNGTFCLSMS